MTLTITARGSNTSTTSGATLAITPTGTIAAGTLAYVHIAADNAGASGASAIASVTDSAGNTWANELSTNRTAGSVANDGTTLGWYVCVLTTQLTTASTVTVNFSPNVTAKCASLTAVTTNQLNRGDAVPYTATTGSGTTGSFTMTAPFAGAQSKGHAGMGFLCASAVERNAIVTVDSDTTDGSWVTLHNIVANTGTTATSQTLYVAYKIATTGVVSQTFNPSWTTTTDYVLHGLYVYERKVPPPDMHRYRHSHNLVR